nr:hypothetical protein [Paenibacillus pinihumi]
MPIGDFNPAPKPQHKRGAKLTQKQKGDISTSVDAELKARSNNKCELRKRCKGDKAVQRAHITGRKQLDHKTTIDDLFHVCLACHKWLDETAEGIRYKRKLRGLPPKIGGVK